MSTLFTYHQITQASRARPDVNLIRTGYLNNKAWMLDAAANWPENIDAAREDLETAVLLLQGLLKKSHTGAQTLVELHNALKEAGCIKTTFSAGFVQIDQSTLSYALVGDTALAHTNQFGEVQLRKDTRVEDFLAAQPEPKTPNQLFKLLSKNQNKPKTFYHLAPGATLLEKHIVQGQAVLNQDFSVFLMGKQAQYLWTLNPQVNSEILSITLSDWARTVRPAEGDKTFERDFCVLKIAPEKCIPTRTSLNWSY